MGPHAFFQALEGRPAPAGLDGLERSYRFEIEGEGSWLVGVRDGHMSVSEDGDARADATIRTSAEVFERIVSGRQSAALAYMRGKVKVDGDLGAVLKLQALLG